MLTVTVKARQTPHASLATSMHSCAMHDQHHLPAVCCSLHTQAIIACRCQRAAPTLTTLFEIAALTAPLIRTPRDEPGPSSSAAGTDSGYASDTASSPPALAAQRPSQRKPHGPDAVLHSPLGVTHALVLLALRCARGWAPAVVVAQGVRLVGSLVQRREQPHEEVRQEGTEGEPAERQCCWECCNLDTVQSCH